MASAIQSKIDVYISFFSLYSFPGVTELNSFEELSDGIYFFLCLNVAAPYAFPTISQTSLNNFCGDNWILRRSNLEFLISTVERFAVNYLMTRGSEPSTPDSSLALDLHSRVNVDVIAKWAPVERAAEDLLTLAGYVATCALMSGNNLISDPVRQKMSRAEQLDLSSDIKHIAALHGLKKLSSQARAVAFATRATRQTNSSYAGSNSAGGAGAGREHARSVERESSPSLNFRAQEDAEIFRNELGLVRSELRDKEQELQISADRAQLMEQQLTVLQGKYQALLATSETKGPSPREHELAVLLSGRDIELQLLRQDLSDAHAREARSAEKVQKLQRDLEKQQAATTHEIALNRSTERKQSLPVKAVADSQVQVSLEDLDLRPVSEDKETECFISDFEQETTKDVHDHIDPNTVVNERGQEQHKNADSSNESGPDETESVNMGALGEQKQKNEQIGALLEEVRREKEIVEQKLIAEQQNVVTEQKKLNQLSETVKLLQAERDSAKTELSQLQLELEKLQDQITADLADQESTRSEIIEKMNKTEEILLQERAVFEQERDAMNTRFDKGRKLMMSEHDILLRLLFHCGQHNLLTQQRRKYLFDVESARSYGSDFSLDVSAHLSKIICTQSSVKSSP